MRISDWSSDVCSSDLRCARPQTRLSPRSPQQLPLAPRPVRQEHQWHAPRFRTRYEIWIPAPRWQPYRDGNSAGPCDESYIERDVGQLAGSDSRGNHCQDAANPRTKENRIPQYRLSFAMGRTVRPIRRYPSLRIVEQNGSTTRSV